MPSRRTGTEDTGHFSLLPPIPHLLEAPARAFVTRLLRGSSPLPSRRPSSASAHLCRTPRGASAMHPTAPPCALPGANGPPHATRHCHVFHARPCRAPRAKGNGYTLHQQPAGRSRTAPPTRNTPHLRVPTRLSIVRRCLCARFFPPPRLTVLRQRRLALISFDVELIYRFQCFLYPAPPPSDIARIERLLESPPSKSDACAKLASLVVEPLRWNCVDDLRPSYLRTP